MSDFTTALEKSSLGPRPTVHWPSAPLNYAVTERVYNRLVVLAEFFFLSWLNKRSNHPFACFLYDWPPPFPTIITLEYRLRSSTSVLKPKPWSFQQPFVYLL
ncbi:hypothetical protein D9757_008599 [Collybiopsis confluens]|uniref:Uncharacterized protein n=1 Tax=Collybiopsis confluens TaxID=2823264 RepID=A0A8H5HMN2_9AGAR|nr:hypothetical protein D9757_008599 [Collybiopsis confluens]